jgi:hypothetical protein
VLTPPVQDSVLFRQLTPGYPLAAPRRETESVYNPQKRGNMAVVSVEAESKASGGCSLKTGLRPIKADKGCGFFCNLSVCSRNPL